MRWSICGRRRARRSGRGDNVEVGAGVFHVSEVGLVDFVSAVAVDEDVDFDSRRARSAKAFVNWPDGAGPVDVGFELDVFLSGVDVLEHGGEELVAVEESVSIWLPVMRGELKRFPVTRVNWGSETEIGSAMR